MKRIREDGEVEIEAKLCQRLPAEIWHEVISKIQSTIWSTDHCVYKEDRVMANLMMASKYLYAFFNRVYSDRLTELREEYAEKVFIVALNNRYKESEWFICHECNTLNLASARNGPNLIEIETSDIVKICIECLQGCDHCDETYCASSYNQHKKCGPRGYLSFEEEEEEEDEDEI